MPCEDFARTKRAGDGILALVARWLGILRIPRLTLIVSANAIANPDRLTVGQRLTIPDRGAPAPLPAPIPAPAPLRPAAPSPLEALNARRLAQLHPLLAERGLELLNQCASDGLVLLVTQTLRTYEEQEALYAKGRTKKPIGKPHIVTYANAGFSWHNFGLAFDVAVLDSSGKMNWDYKHPGWARTGAIGKSLGLEWGGDWTRLKDYPHFEYTAELSLKDCRNMYAGGLQEIWSSLA